MGRSYYFVEAPDSPGEVVAWFRSLAEPPEETITDNGVVLFFRQIAPLGLDDRGHADGARSPVVNVMLPTVRRPVLWTTGAAHFLTAPISRFPQIAKVHRDFKAWMTNYPLVHDPMRGAENHYGYYLVGGAANRGPLYGLPSGIAALERGQYFVDPQDNETVLNVVCRTLRLRGLDCGQVE